VHQAAFLVVMASWAICGALLVVHYRTLVAPGRRTKPAALVGLLLQSIGFAFVWAWRRPPSTPLVPVGAVVQPFLDALASALAVGAVIVDVQAIRVLGRHWSLAARVLEGHELITTGPYRFVRHPIYAALLGLLVATGIVIGAPAGTALAVVFYAAGTAVRVRSEEALLRAEFGEAWQEYARRVPAVVPFVRVRRP
jgi:protein-S-isoprenylcysteine O-methyltransferase Ste14